MPKKQLNFEDVEPYCAMQCLQSNDSNSCATELLLLAKIVVAADQVLSIGGYVQARKSQWAHAACRLLQLLPLPSKIRKAVHFEGTLSRDANSLVRAEESHDVVPMLCHFACRAELAIADVDLLAGDPRPRLPAPPCMQRSKPLARIRNLQYLKIAGCSGMLARTVRAQVPTAPGSRAALAGSLLQFWATAESCRSIPTLRGTMMSYSKSGKRQQ